ncbi:MAG: S49 family peptidase, partial [Oligoflexia bacterium]|nr:S49 family peptidase [Oligoflexia bacterium]
LRQNKIPLTVCVDKIAGSGGYLMACVGNQILASPFAFVGSIGVLMGLPNIHEFLKKHNISYEEFTAGKYKRTVTPLGQITEDKRKRLQQQLELVHQQFKNFVKQYRNIDLEEVATGEAWLAETALKKGLVDRLKCSDDYILEKIKTHNVYKVTLKQAQSFLEKLTSKKPLATQALEELLQKNWII